MHWYDLGSDPNVADSFGGPLAHTFGVNVEQRIAAAPEGTTPVFLGVVPEGALIANVGRKFPDLAQKAGEAHDGKIWVLVADGGGPALLSIAVEDLALGGGDA